MSEVGPGEIPQQPQQKKVESSKVPDPSKRNFLKGAAILGAGLVVGEKVSNLPSPEYGKYDKFIVETEHARVTLLLEKHDRSLEVKDLQELGPIDGLYFERLFTQEGMERYSVGELASSPVMNLDDLKGKPVRPSFIPEEVINYCIDNKISVGFESLYIPDEMLEANAQNDAMDIAIGAAGVVGSAPLGAYALSKDIQPNKQTRRDFLKTMVTGAAAGVSATVGARLLIPQAARNLNATISVQGQDSPISHKVEDMFRALQVKTQGWSKNQWRWGFRDLENAIRIETEAKALQAQSGSREKQNIVAVVGNLHSAIATEFLAMDEASRFAALTLFDKDDLNKIVDANGGIEGFSKFYFGTGEGELSPNSNGPAKYFVDQELKTFLEDYYQPQAA